MPGAPAEDEGLLVLTGRKLDSDSATTSERERHRHHLSIISLAPSIFPSLVRPSDVNRTRCSIFILRSQRHSRRVAQNGLSERQPGDSRRRTKSGPDFCWICSRYLLLLFSSYFFVRLKSEGTIDRLSAFCDIAIGACCESEAGIRRRRRRL